MAPTASWTEAPPPEAIVLIVPSRAVCTAEEKVVRASVSTPNPLHRSAQVNQEKATRGKEKEKEREKAGAEEEKVGTEEEEAEKEAENAEKVVEEEGERKVGAVRDLRVSGSVNGEEEGK